MNSSSVFIFELKSIQNIFQSVCSNINIYIVFFYSVIHKHYPEKKNIKFIKFLRLLKTCNFSILPYNTDEITFFSGQLIYKRKPHHSETFKIIIDIYSSI